MRPSWRAAAALAALLALGGAGWAAWRQDWTYDEPFHLAWSERLLASGETERASQQRFNSKTPVSLANAAAFRLARAAGVAEPRAQRFFARLPTVMALALLLGVLFAGTRALAGERAACLATLGAALDPNLVAHGSLVTVDTPYALATLLTLLAALGYARAPSAGRAGLLGLALGLAFATKFTAVLLLAGLPLLPLASPEAARAHWRHGRRVAAHAALAALAALAVVDAAYLGRGLARPIGEANLASAPLAALARALPGLRLPLPLSFLEGLDGSLGAERGWGPVVLLGRAHEDGVFYYFPVVWALKTPLPLLAGLAAGLAAGVGSGWLRRDPAARFLLWNGLVTLAYFSFFFKTQIGFRFVLMCVPLAWLLAAPGLLALLQGRGRLVAIAAALAAAENLPYLGNPLAFTNAAVQPKRRAYRLLADSNIEWGQNRDKVQGWLAERGIPRQRLDPLHVLAGPNVFTLNAVAGVFDFERHRWLRGNADPVEHLGHSYLRYDVDNASFERFLDEERRLAPGATAAAFCAGGAGEPLAAGTQLPFLREEAPEPDRVWVACVRSERRFDLGFRVLEGRVRQGLLRPDGSCEADLLQDEQVSWRRLEPGTHALCAVELPNRRASLPYRLEAYWIVRGQAAAVDVAPRRAGADGRLSGP